MIWSVDKGGSGGWGSISCENVRISRRLCILHKPSGSSSIGQASTVYTNILKKSALSKRYGLRERKREREEKRDRKRKREGEGERERVRESSSMEQASAE